MKKLYQWLAGNSRQYHEETSLRITWGHWFALFNVLLAILIASRYAFNADWPNTLFGKLYFFVSLFGHFSFVVFAVYLLLLFPLSFVIKNNRAFRGISVVLATIGMTMLLVDTEIFKQFYLHLSPLVWDLLVNPDEGELSRQWQLLFVPMPLILLAEMLYSRWCWNKIRSFSRQTWGKFVALFFLSCFIATHLLYAWADMALYRPVTAQKSNYPLSYPMTARTFLERHGLVNRSAFEQAIEENGRLDTFYLNYPKQPLQFSANSSAANLLFINFSGLKNSAITQETMPILHEISQNAYRFTQHYSAGNTTSGSILSLFYSLSGRYLDAVLNEKKRSVLMTTLQQRQYRFGLFSHNGFDDPIYRTLFADFKLRNSQNNAAVVKQWQSWLNSSLTTPFFSYLDFTLPAAADYSAQAQSYDALLAEIWQTLNERKLLPNTLLLITADLAEQTAFANKFDARRIQVPLIVYWQGDMLLYTQISSHLDILPTLLTQLFGVTSPISYFSQGADLTQINERKWLLASDYKWNVAITAEGEQYHIDRKGDFEYYTDTGEKQKETRPPLALFLQLIQQSNQFIEN